jgi:hypothetical protein
MRGSAIGSLRIKTETAPNTQTLVTAIHGNQGSSWHKMTGKNIRLNKNTKVRLFDKLTHFFLTYTQAGGYIRRKYALTGIQNIEVNNVSNVIIIHPKGKYHVKCRATLAPPNAMVGSGVAEE